MKESISSEQGVTTVGDAQKIAPRTSAHTPGPWRVSRAKPTKTRGIDVLAGYASAVAHIPVPPAYMTEHPEQANARLIAEAPTLLDALTQAAVELEEAANLFSGRPLESLYRAAAEKARRATARALGEP